MGAFRRGKSDFLFGVAKPPELPWQLVLLVVLAFLIVLILLIN